MNDWRYTEQWMTLKDPDGNEKKHFVKYMAVDDTEGPDDNKVSLGYTYLMPVMRISEMYLIVAECSNDEAEEVLICYNKGGFIPNIVAREREVQTVLLEVSAGFGVAILPEYAVRHYRNARNLVVVPLLRADGSPEELDFEIAWRQSNPNPAIEKLLQWVETHEYVE